ncbi:MAG: hypothetical protein U5K29_02385 [Acidimicrobiales bacterium]|nr:hypothetical protein [Acidimicrobiales bacterium]
MFDPERWVHHLEFHEVEYILAGDDITPEVLVEREVLTWETDLGRIDTMVGISAPVTRSRHRLAQG